MQIGSLWFETLGERYRDRAIILLHGFTGSHSTWEMLSKKLVDEDYFLVLPDLPGHGRSADSTAMSVDRVCDSLLEILYDLKISKATILGYSMGARIALNFAIVYQSHTRSLILESCTPGILDEAERQKRRLDDESLGKSIRRRGLDWFVDYWENLEVFASQKSLDGGIRARIRNERFSNSPIGLAKSLEGAGTGSMLPMWLKLRDIRVPVLLLAGEKDEKYISIAKEMKRKMPANSTLSIIKDSGHAPHIEDYPKFENTITNFLRDVHS